MEFKINNIHKSFKKKKVVSDVNLTLGEGIHALLGPNGSGKTTLMRIACGVLEDDENGIIDFDGITIDKQRETYLSNLGYVPQHFGYYPNYTVEQFLRYIGTVKGLKKDYLNGRISELLIQLRLDDARKKKMKHLSGGMLRRVAIAQALLNKPKLLILDEPTVGLDPKERINFKNLISSLSEDMIILLSTHIVSDIESIADDIIVMKEGAVLFHDTEEALLKEMNGYVWQVELSTVEAKQLMNDLMIVDTNIHNGTAKIRIVNHTQPHPSARLVTPQLEDFYLYHFKEESYDDSIN